LIFMLRPFVAVSIAMLASAGLCHAAEPEQLLVKPPSGFKIAAETRTAKENTVVLVPAAESASGWTEQITLQTLYKQAEQSPEAYRETAQKATSASCPEVQIERLKQGTENLYPMASWSARCPRAKDGGKPETTWWKAVQGRENFYLIRAVARSELSEKQRKAWAKFFDATRVCDSRVPGQRCKVK